MVSPVAAVGGQGFAGGAAPVEGFHIRDIDPCLVPVLIAGGQRGHNEGTEQNQG